MLAGGLQKFNWLTAVAHSYFLAAELHYKMSGNTQNTFPNLTYCGKNCCCCHKNLKQLQKRRMVSVQMWVGGAACAIYQTRSALNNSSVWKAKKEGHLVSRSLERSKAMEGSRGRDQPGMRWSQPGDQSNLLLCKKGGFAPDTQRWFLNLYDTIECISLIMFKK